MNGAKAVDLASARVWISNDDGIDAAGLKVLEETVRPMVREVWISAPSDGHSGASAMVSLRREITVERLGERRYAVSGRPADSLLAALRITMRESPPDLVLSGINHGANIGVDMIYSGTVGVAMTAALNGLPAVALSADHPPGEPVAEGTWADIREHLPDVLRRLCAAGFRAGGAYGVNFPQRIRDADPVFCRQGDVGDTMVYDVVDAASGRYRLAHLGSGEGTRDGTDFGAVAAGRIGVTPLTIDRTDHDALLSLQ
jgi:5'-nucleotidase